MRFISAFSAFLATFSHVAIAFPDYGSLAGLSDAQLAKFVATLEVREPGRLPRPQKDTSAKLVNDKAHPWKPLAPGDIRGPCPGLNTLASHGWLPRNGIASPSEIVTKVMEGFNMDFGLAVFVTYASHLVDGNLLTDRLSIGSKTPLTGPDPPAPAIVGGLDTHAVFEGDTSMTRGDFFFGNNHDFNETLFDEMTKFANQFGAGNYNLTVAGEYRAQRIKDSTATNPTFSFVAPRYFTAFAESTFPISFFIDGRQTDGQLNMTVARGFFQNSQMPDGFFRANGARSTEGIIQVFEAHPIAPGRNVGGVNNYVVDPTSANFNDLCLLYVNFVNETVRSLYPNTTGALRDALNTNLDFFFIGANLTIGPCTQIFPFGKINR
jgi:hypothetical protein